MSWQLMILPTLCYVGVSASELHRGHPGLALAFFGYALANVGFIMEMLR